MRNRRDEIKKLIEFNTVESTYHITGIKSFDYYSVAISSKNGVKYGGGLTLDEARKSAKYCDMMKWESLNDDFIFRILEEKESKVFITGE